MAGGRPIAHHRPRRSSPAGRSPARRGSPVRERLPPRPHRNRARSSGAGARRCRSPPSGPVRHPDPGVLAVRGTRSRRARAAAAQRRSVGRPGLASGAAAGARPRRCRSRDRPRLAPPALSRHRAARRPGPARRAVVPGRRPGRHRRATDPAARPRVAGPRGGGAPGPRGARTRPGRGGRGRLPCGPRDASSSPCRWGTGPGRRGGRGGRAALDRAPRAGDDPAGGCLGGDGDGGRAGRGCLLSSSWAAWPRPRSAPSVYRRSRWSPGAWPRSSRWTGWRWSWSASRSPPSWPRLWSPVSPTT